MRLLHNPRCSKSREALALLSARGDAVEVIEYLRTPLSAPELGALFDALGLEPPAAMRLQDDLAKSLGLAATDPRSRDEWIALLCAHPALLERPIAIKQGRAVIGRPPQRALEL
jgi:arsenate reductase